MERPEFWNHGPRFVCTRCSHCCRHESGYVFLSDLDVSRLTRHFGLSRSAFLDGYCRTVQFGEMRQISLRERSNNDCVFWIDGGCAVYHARPVQCRTYPFWAGIVDDDTSWQRESTACPGIGVGRRYSSDEIVDLIAKRVHNPPLRVEAHR